MVSYSAADLVVARYVSFIVLALLLHGGVGAAAGAAAAGAAADAAADAAAARASAGGGRVLRSGQMLVIGYCAADLVVTRYVSFVVLALVLQGRAAAAAAAGATGASAAAGAVRGEHVPRSG